jgi:hypothetical protein
MSPKQPWFLTLLVAATMFCSSSNAIGASANPTGGAAPNNITESYGSELSRLTERVEEIRRDQLNYKVEKDLLKETYSSNTESINTVVTIVLAAFAIFGYLGVRGIESLKADFKKELDELRALRTAFESKVASVDSQLADAVSQVEQIGKVNIEQDRRLRVLEIQEKCSAWLKQRNFARALEYANIGIELSGRDSLLVRIKAFCQMKLGNISDAYETFKFHADLSPENIDTITNIVELGAFLGKVEEASALLSANEEAIIKTSGVHVAWYLRAIVLCCGGKVDALKQHLAAPPPKGDTDKMRRIAEKWSFDEVRIYLRKDRKDANGEYLSKAADYLEGKIGHDEFVAFVGAAA